MLDDGPEGKKLGWRVYGKGSVTLYRKGNPTVYRTGEAFEEDLSAK
jgi:hypothetical protein